MNPAWIEIGADQLVRSVAKDIVAQLSSALLTRNLPGTAALHRSWQITVEALQAALAQDEARRWTVLLEYPLLRVRKRIDAVILTAKAVLALEFKTGTTKAGDVAARQADDYAQDLHDFHAGCRGFPVVPIAVVARGAPAGEDPVLCWHGVVPARVVTIDRLAEALRSIDESIPNPTLPLDPHWWLKQPYRPVPNIVEAARMAFARQAVPDIDAARAEPAGLRRTTAAILAHLERARSNKQHLAIFVTGIPGAGKTRCGLAVAFEAGDESRGVYLTGNPTLVHVFREALARDAIDDGVQAKKARHDMEKGIQALPDFRDTYVARPNDVPAEHVIVIDEAQRSWDREHAVRKTSDRDAKLTDSEPGHILDAMARHSDWAVVVCLIGGGQEIHDGEGGLAEWGSAIEARPRWRCAIAPEGMRTDDVRQQLLLRPQDSEDPALHLAVPVRSLRNAAAARWVDCVLSGDRHGALEVVADGAVPYSITRDLHVMRDHLRATARGHRSAGIVSSSAAKRLRADGLGVELPHMDSKVVARWFLDRWPDVRACNALEVTATEFSCQGLELDFVGVAWGGDLIRSHGGWHVRYFHGDRWKQRQAGTDYASNRLNTYRVLLTRARYETVIWVPRGSRRGDAHHDRTRDAEELDAIAEFLLACGARPLEAAPKDAQDTATPALL